MSKTNDYKKLIWYKHQTIASLLYYLSGWCPFFTFHLNRAILMIIDQVYLRPFKLVAFIVLV
jgi:hypothetical protein